MNTHDDRKEFNNNTYKMSMRLGEDEHVFQKSLELINDLDKYDYSYLWSWMGVPIIQMPADIVATQEVIWQTKPDVIVETGVARGGSVVFMASLLEVIGNGKVIGVDIEIRQHNREIIETHPMNKRITLIEGESVAPKTVNTVKAQIPDGSRVMVVLDSDHSKEHVFAECREYGPMVTEGCFLIIADTLLGHVEEENAPKKRSKILYRGNEPLTALNDYLEECDRFELDAPINGKLILSSSPGGYLRCIKE